MHGVVTASDLTVNNGNLLKFQMFSVPVFQCSLLVSTLLPQPDFSHLLFTCPEFVDWSPFFLFSTFFEAVNWAFIYCLSFPGLFPVSKIDHVLFFSCIVFKVIFLFSFSASISFSLRSTACFSS